MGKYVTQVETRFIMNSIDLSKANTVMDVGAEAGRFSQLSKATSTETISLDINSYGLKRLKLKTKNINAIQADARKTPIEDRTFDVIFMIEVLDYIFELDEALAECHRTLKPNAPLILSFGNKSSLKAKLREISGKSYQHSYRKVTKALVEAGFFNQGKNRIQLASFRAHVRKPHDSYPSQNGTTFRIAKNPQLKPLGNNPRYEMSLNLLK